jgi:hypothetical protein
MRRADGTPWIHVATAYCLEPSTTPACAERRKAAKDDVATTFTRLAAGADLDPVELAELRLLAKISPASACA